MKLIKEYAPLLVVVIIGLIVYDMFVSKMVGTDTYEGYMDGFEGEYIQ